MRFGAMVFAMRMVAMFPLRSARLVLAALASLTVRVALLMHALAIMLSAELVHRRHVMAGMHASAERHSDDQRHPCQSRSHVITPRFSQCSTSIGPVAPFAFDNSQTLALDPLT